MTTTTHTHVPLDVAVELAYGMTGSLADSLGVRMLVIKGLSLSAQGLRQPRVPADADILVEPERHAELTTALMERGWRQRNGRPFPTLLPAHSMELIRDDWPCDIDLHHYYPGFFADPADTFELLWARRTFLSFAANRVPTAGVESNLAIMGLHAARNPRSDRHQRELRYALDHGTFDHEAFREVVRGGRAQTTLMPLLGSTGLSFQDDLSSDEMATWQLYVETNEQGSTVAWLTAIGRAQWRQKPRVLAHALFPPAQELMLESVNGSGKSVISRTRLRISRLGKALRAGPHALTSLYRHHRNQRTEHPSTK